MAKNELGKYVGGIGERSVEGAFASLLRLTGDAVIAFDGAGTILFANDQVGRCFYHPWGDFEGADVRLLFPPAIGVVPDAPFTPKSLPFELDGSAQVLTCVGAAGQSLEVRVRCERVNAPGATYLLVACPNDSAAAAEGEHDRLVEELSRANKRLSGTLDIVLGTIDSTNVKTLFSRALGAIVETMEAEGSVMYLAERDGFHLRGTSEGLDLSHVSRFVPYGRVIENLATREGHALRLRVLPPEREELRRGKLVTRRVIDEETHHIYKVRTMALPPFVSFLAVPVWFGGHIIALIEVGWTSTHPMRRDDSQLLDAVAQYLSVQLVGAFSALRAKKSDQLAALSSRLREKAMAADDLNTAFLDNVMRQAAQELDARLVRLYPAEGGYRLESPSGEKADAGAREVGGSGSVDGASAATGRRATAGDTTLARSSGDNLVLPKVLLHEASEGEAPAAVGEPAGASVMSAASDGASAAPNKSAMTSGGTVAPGAATAATQATAEASATASSDDAATAPEAAETASPGAWALEGSALAKWLSVHGMGSVGAAVSLGQVEGQPYLALVLRNDSAQFYGEPEPFSSIEMDFLGEFTVDLSELVAGGEAHAQDKHIAQALQSGMKNELQKVDGITAEGLYSSATAQAFVGGDFYDLIRLPGRRACVIMGDVSGKGVEAASVSAAVRTALGAYAWEGLRPARMVRSLNDFLLGFSRLETFATLFVGIVDLEAGTLTYCSAGHPPALLMHAASGELAQLDVQSGVVGAFKDMLYQDGVANLHPGDMLLLYTDGTTEARAPSGAFFGEDGLRDVVMSEWQHGFTGITQRLLASLDRFTHNRLDDDVAIVALRFDTVG